MTIVTTCPSCGFESAEIRCPRCNALKVVGCSGVCSACVSACSKGAVPMPPEASRDEDAVDDPQPATTDATR